MSPAFVKTMRGTAEKNCIDATIKELVEGNKLSPIEAIACLWHWSSNYINTIDDFLLVKEKVEEFCKKTIDLSEILDSKVFMDYIKAEGMPSGYAKTIADLVERERAKDLAFASYSPSEKFEYYLKNGKLEEAKEILDYKIGAFSGRNLRIKLAEAYLAVGDIDKATSAADSATSINLDGSGVNPCCDSIRILIARAYLAIGKIAKAKEVVAWISNNDPRLKGILSEIAAAS